MITLFTVLTALSALWFGFLLISWIEYNNKIINKGEI